MSNCIVPCLKGISVLLAGTGCFLLYEGWSNRIGRMSPHIVNRNITVEQYNTDFNQRIQLREHEVMQWTSNLLNSRCHTNNIGSRNNINITNRFEEISNDDIDNHSSYTI
jgi:hypothetical protein